MMHDVCRREDGAAVVFQTLQPCTDTLTLVRVLTGLVKVPISAVQPASSTELASTLMSPTMITDTLFYLPVCQFASRVGPHVAFVNSDETKRD